MPSYYFVFFITFEEYKYKYKYKYNYKYYSDMISRVTPCNKGITVPLVSKSQRQRSSAPCNLLLVFFLFFPARCAATYLYISLENHHHHGEGDHALESDDHDDHDLDGEMPWIVVMITTWMTRMILIWIMRKPG